MLTKPFSFRPDECEAEEGDYLTYETHSSFLTPEHLPLPPSTLTVSPGGECETRTLESEVITPTATREGTTSVEAEPEVNSKLLTKRAQGHQMLLDIFQTDQSDEDSASVEGR